MTVQWNSPALTPIFKMMAFQNKLKSKEAGRPIFDDWEMVEIRIAGSKDFPVQPAHAFSHWAVNEEGEQVPVTYAERFAPQYRQFKQREVQTKSGTPLDYLPFLTEGKRSELRALAIYTAEALAEIEGQPLKMLGMHGRELKNKAQEYLASSSHEAVLARQQSQIEALQAQLAILEDDRKLLGGPKPEPVPNDDDDEEEPAPDGEEIVQSGPGIPAEFVGMGRKQLRKFITDRTGQRPVGAPKLGTLIRMASEARA